MNSDNKYEFTKQQVAKSFNKAAKSYDKATLLPNIIGERLLERLDLLKITPELIIDLGSATGHFTPLLQKKFKGKKILGIDIAWKMSVVAQSRRKWLSRYRYLCADGEALPLKDNSVDVIFSNLMLQWVNNPDQIFAEAQRVLKPGGLIMFTSFGPDTLSEMRDSWTTVDEYVHVNRFMDMHDTGDSLSKCGFEGIVMDNETLTLNYETIEDLHQDLRDLGESNINNGRNKSVTSKSVWQSYLSNYQRLKTEQGDYPASWEVVYGHAWATESVASDGIHLGTQAGNIPVRSL